MIKNGLLDSRDDETFQHKEQIKELVIYLIGSYIFLYLNSSYL